MPRPPGSATLAELKEAAGAGNFLESHDDVAPYLSDFRRLYQGATPLVLRPRSVDEGARILRLCQRDGVAVVPHGGNTSYCGGATPDESGAQIVVSLQRLNRVRQVDAANYSMIVEAGCTLAGAQTAAREANRLFPLSLGSEGTAQIGGNLSTNAGGTAVLRYGMMRDLVLGLEVVLADGRVLSALKSLRKDNTGYDVKSLFIGAEGTLGIITAASIQLLRLRLVLADRTELAEPEPESDGAFDLGAGRCGGRRRAQGRHAGDFTCPGAGHVEIARVGPGGAAAPRRQHQARRLGSGLRHSHAHRERQRAGAQARSRGRRGLLRARGRRQSA